MWEWPLALAALCACGYALLPALRRLCSKRLHAHTRLLDEDASVHLAIIPRILLLGPVSGA